MIEEKQKALALLYEEFCAKEEALLDSLTKEEREALGHPIKSVKHLDTFMANGHKYVVRTTLALSRFEEFEKLQVEVGWGVSFEKIFEQQLKAFNYLNTNELANASVVLYNSMNAIKDKLDDRKNPILLLCALFICREDENLAVYDEAVNAAKIKDWTAEGIAMEIFFSIAFGLVNGFMPIYEKISENILTQQPNKKTKAN